MELIEKQIITTIQHNFPIETYPFAALALEHDTDEMAAIDTIKRLKSDGIIRRIGAFFNAPKLGYTSSLIATQVPDNVLAAFIIKVNTLPGVSHNYGRAHKYNVWFTLTMPSTAAIDTTLAELKQQFNLPAIYSLPAEKFFKLRVNFVLDGDEPTDPSQPGTSTHTPMVTDPGFTESQIALIRLLQEDIPITPSPFDDIARSIDAKPDWVLQQIETWKDNATIRRFGAAIRHQRVGFSVNAMVVFDIEPDRTDTVGPQLARFPQVSHCYQRPTAPDWPYNLFAMTHCADQAQLETVIDHMIHTVKPRQHHALLTTHEYKKDTTKFFLE